MNKRKTMSTQDDDENKQNKKARPDYELKIQKKEKQISCSTLKEKQIFNCISNEISFWHAKHKSPKVYTLSDLLFHVNEMFDKQPLICQEWKKLVRLWSGAKQSFRGALLEEIIHRRFHLLFNDIWSITYYRDCLERIIFKWINHPNPVLVKSMISLCCWMKDLQCPFTNLIQLLDVMNENKNKKHRHTIEELWNHCYSASIYDWIRCDIIKPFINSYIKVSQEEKNTGSLELRSIVYALTLDTVIDMNVICKFIQNAIKYDDKDALALVLHTYNFEKKIMTGLFYVSFGLSSYKCCNLFLSFSRELGENVFNALTRPSSKLKLDSDHTYMMPVLVQINAYNESENYNDLERVFFLFKNLAPWCNHHLYIKLWMKHRCIWIFQRIINIVIEYGGFNFITHELALERTFLTQDRRLDCIRIQDSRLENLCNIALINASYYWRCLAILLDNVPDHEIMELCLCPSVYDLITKWFSSQITLWIPEWCNKVFSRVINLWWWKIYKEEDEKFTKSTKRNLNIQEIIFHALENSHSFAFYDWIQQIDSFKSIKDVVSYDVQIVHDSLYTLFIGIKNRLLKIYDGKFHLEAPASFKQQQQQLNFFFDTNENQKEKSNETLLFEKFIFPYCFNHTQNNNILLFLYCFPQCAHLVSHSNPNTNKHMFSQLEIPFAKLTSLKQQKDASRLVYLSPFLISDISQIVLEYFESEYEDYCELVESIHF